MAKINIYAVMLSRNRMCGQEKSLDRKIKQQ